MRVSPQQRDGGQQRRRRADAALRRALDMERPAQPRDERVCAVEALNRLHDATLNLTCGDQTGADRLAVEQHGAGAAIAGVAADLHAGKPAALAQGVGQALRAVAEARRGAVQGQGNAGRDVEHQTAPPGSPARHRSSARRVSVSAASRRKFTSARRSSMGASASKSPALQTVAQRRLRRAPLQPPLGGGKAHRHRRAGADRDARVAHDAVLDLQRDRDHDDGDDEVAPSAQFQKSRAPTLRRLGADDGGEDFIGRERRPPRPEQEVFERQAARAAPRDEFNLGSDRQQRRDAVGGGRGVAEIAGERALILHLNRADLARRGL